MQPVAEITDLIRSLERGVASLAFGWDVAKVQSLLEKIR